MKLEEKLDLFLINEKSKYDMYFEKKMKEWGIKSPAELSKADKVKFFNEVDRGWKAKKESD